VSGASDDERLEAILAVILELQPVLLDDVERWADHEPANHRRDAVRAHPYVAPVPAELGK
jgi:hypothetical protein